MRLITLTILLLLIFVSACSVKPDIRYTERNSFCNNAKYYIHTTSRNNAYVTDNYTIYDNYIIISKFVDASGVDWGTIENREVRLPISLFIIENN
jgi:hypothetical protein